MCPNAKESPIPKTYAKSQRQSTMTTSPPKNSAPDSLARTNHESLHIICTTDHHARHRCKRRIRDQIPARCPLTASVHSASSTACTTTSLLLASAKFFHLIQSLKGKILTWFSVALYRSLAGRWRRRRIGYLRQHFCRTHQRQKEERQHA